MNLMSMQFFIISLSAATLSFALTVVLKKVSNKLNITSRNDFRRKTSSTPLLGGLSIYISALAVSYFATDNQPLFTTLLCALPIVIIGVIDDLKEVGARPRLAAQFIAGSIWFYFSYTASTTLYQMQVPEFLNYAISLFWIITLCNAINFIDGIDGQATTISAIIFAGLGFVGYSTSMASPIFLGALLGFLVLNWHPAKIYLGEVGSSILGFMLATESLQTPLRLPPAAQVIAILFLFAFPLIDLTYATVRRAQKRQSPLRGDRDHIHHKLQKIGFSITKTLFLTATVTALTCSFALILFQISDIKINFMLSVTAACTLSILLYAFIYTETRLGMQVSVYGRTLLEKHIKFNKRATLIKPEMRAIVFDLLPYYKELQQKGLPATNNFVIELSEIISKMQNDKKYLLGSYSIALIFNHPDDLSLPIRNEFISKVKTLLEKYEVVKSSAKIPDGLYFYGKHNHKQLLKLISKTAYDLQKKAS